MEHLQEKKNESGIFLERTDKLALRMRVSLRELAPKIGLSVASLFGYRSGALKITAKAWGKLERAERDAGIGSKPHDAVLIAASPAESSVNPKESLGLEARVAALEAENAALRETLAEFFERMQPLLCGPRLKKGYREGAE